MSSAAFEWPIRGSPNTLKGRPERAVVLAMRLLLPLGLLATSPLLAQGYDLVVVPGQSSSTLSISVGTDLTGTLRGDFDPAVNPQGTQTLPGLFGGNPTDNVPIPTDLSVAGTTTLTGDPLGSLEVLLEGTALTVEGLEVDLLGREIGALTLNLGLAFDTFRTFNPDSLYIGGFPLDIPVGEVPILSASLVQEAPGVGTATQTPAGPLQVDVVLPMALTLEVELQGAPLPLGPLPLALPLTGLLDLEGEAVALDAALSLVFDEVVDDPFPGTTFDDVPLPLPTILPPGGTANLLLNLLIEQLFGNGSVDLVVRAEGGPSCGVETFCTAEPNSTGVPAVIQAVGAPVIGALGFVVEDIPLSQYGMFLASYTTDEVPGFGGEVGTLCLGGNVVAFNQNVLWSRGVGSVTFTPEWNSPLPGGLVVQPGDTLHFQYWYRDYPAGGGTNFSQPLSVTFCP